MKLDHKLEYLYPEFYEEKGKLWYWYRCLDCGCKFRSDVPPGQKRGHLAKWRPREE